MGFSTRAAGLAAAEKNNICGVGVAYSSSICSLGVDLSSADEVAIASGLLSTLSSVDVYCYSGLRALPGASPDLRRLSRVLSDASTFVSSEGRDGRGAIQVSNLVGSAHRGGHCGLSEYLTLPEVLVAATITHANRSAAHVEDCSSTLVTVPGAGDDSYLTTSSPEGCDKEWGVDVPGTSSALLSGVVALMLEANSRLGWRDVKHVLLTTATQVDVDGYGWETNGANLPIHYKVCGNCSLFHFRIDLENCSVYCTT